MDVEMRLPNDLGVIGAVIDFTYKWGLNAGLDGPHARRLALAMDELISDIVQFAFWDEESHFDLTFRRDLSTVEIIVQEEGQPFDPDRYRYDRDRAVNEGNFEGAGLKLIRHLVDEFTFLNKGKEGKEFRLAMTITAEHIAERFSGDPALSPTSADENTEYELHLVTTADAEDVSKLIYRTYGYTYVKDSLYFPDKVERALDRGEKFGVIVRTGCGEAVGYFAVLHTTDSNIGEVGEAVVSVNHRRRGLMTKMLDALIQEAKARSLHGVFGEAVTVHTISQRANAHFDFKSTALVLGTFEAERFKGLVDSYPQPLSVIIDFLPLVDPEPRTAYLPSKYADLLQAIYDELDFTLQRPEPAPVDLADESDLDLHINYKHRYALIVVREYGRDLDDQIEQMVADLDSEDLKVLYIDLPLDDPTTPRAAQVVRQLGFIFSGLMPFFHQERDYLRLQRPMVALDMDYIHVYSDLAKTIKQTVSEELEWATKKLKTSST